MRLYRRWLADELLDELESPLEALLDRCLGGQGFLQDFAVSDREYVLFVQSMNTGDTAGAA